MFPDQPTPRANRHAERTDTRKRRNASTHAAPESFEQLGARPRRRPGGTTAREQPGQVTGYDDPYSRSACISPCSRAGWTAKAPQAPQPSHLRILPRQSRPSRGPDRGAAALTAPADRPTAAGAVAWSQSPSASAAAAGTSSAAQATRGRRDGRPPGRDPAAVRRGTGSAARPHQSFTSPAPAGAGHGSATGGCGRPSSGRAVGRRRRPAGGRRGCVAPGSPRRPRHPRPGRGRCAPTTARRTRRGTGVHPAEAHDTLARLHPAGRMERRAAPWTPCSAWSRPVP
ncbi:hypothetical protein SUDANB180_07384 [Streptomyces sp. enrichment culture]